MIRRSWIGDFAAIARIVRNQADKLQQLEDLIEEQRRWWSAIGIPRRRKKDTGYFVDRRYLHELMQEAFSNNELIGVCMALGVDWDDLEGETKDTRMWSLIEHLERRSELYKLLDECRTRRPNYDWPLV